MMFRIATPDDLDALLQGALRAYGTRIRDIDSTARFALHVLNDRNWLVLTGGDEPAGETVSVSQVSPLFFDPKHSEHLAWHHWTHTGRVFMLSAMMRAHMEWAKSMRAIEHVFTPGSDERVTALARRCGYGKERSVYVRSY